MKKPLLLAFTLLLILQSKVNHAQSAKSWLQLMHDTGANFYDVQKSFYNWYNTQPQKANEIFKEDDESNAEYMQFKRWEYINAPRVYPTGKLPAIGFADYQKNINKRAPDKSAKAASTNTWQLLGPSTIPALSPGYDSTNTSGWCGGGAGRLNMVWFNPLKTTTLYAGSGSGGLWRSYDAGKTWTPIGDQLATLGVTDLQCVPNDTNTLYLATGDMDGGAIPSVGLLKSTDNGKTWHATGLSFTLNQGINLGNILIDPTNVKTLYVATNNGVMKSTDSAHTWRQLTTWSDNSVSNIEMNPGNHSLIYATTFNGVYYYSPDGGTTWNQPPSLPASGQAVREAIGVTPANPAYVYVMAASQANNGFYGFYKSTDSGKTFTAQFTYAVDSVNILSWAKTGKGDQYGFPDIGGQGWYDLPIAVNPKNPLQVIVAGVDIWETNDGGTTWAYSSFWADSANKPDYAHADVHRIIYLPDSSGVYAGTDGGIFIKNISGVWSDISSGLSIGQLYKLGASSHTNNLVISGWQDNGTSENNGPGSSWQEVMGSDGSTCVIDWSNDAYQYGSYVGGLLEASIDGGQSFNIISSSITDNGNWVTPFVQDPVNFQTLYAGYSHVWKTTNRGATWTQLPSMGNSYSIADLRVAASNNQYIYATTGIDVYVSQNGGTTWSTIDAGLPITNDWCNELCVSPTNPDKVWAVFSGWDTNRVYYSSNAGLTWKSVSTGLPQYPINCIIYQNGTKDGIYIGTDIGGIYYRDSTTNGWVAYSTGLPNVRISDFQMNYISNKIIAATYGRSIWECNFLNTPSAVNDITQQQNSGLNVYPNPNTGEFTVKFAADNSTQYLLEVTNVLGQIVYQKNISAASGEYTANLNLNGYGKGVYMVVLKKGQEQESIKKVVVE
jgi:photosystem II stability/assembly factor-like uncharacterized protein